jgi:hypothetical protein
VHKPSFANVGIILGSIASLLTIVGFGISYLGSNEETQLKDPLTVDQYLGDDYVLQFRNSASSTVWIIHHFDWLVQKDGKSGSYKDGMRFVDLNQRPTNRALNPGELLEVKYNFGTSEFRDKVIENNKVMTEICYCLENRNSCWVKNRRVSTTYSSVEQNVRSVPDCSDQSIYKASQTNG